MKVVPQQASNGSSAESRWPSFDARRGTGTQPFPQRLARARLIYLRRRELASGWLALSLATLGVFSDSYTLRKTPTNQGPDSYFLSPGADAFRSNRNVKPAD